MCFCEWIIFQAQKKNVTHLFAIHTKSHHQLFNFEMHFLTLYKEHHFLVSSNVSFVFLQVEGTNPSQTSAATGSKQSRKSKSTCSLPHKHTGTRWPTQPTFLFLNSLCRCVLFQAVLEFHKQVGNAVDVISQQYNELFSANGQLSQNQSQEQMLQQLMGALNVSGRYFSFSEQFKVKT